MQEWKSNQSVSPVFIQGDLVYLNTQVTAAGANPDIPMFGLDLNLGTTRLVLATENVVSTELPQVSQTLSAMAKVPAIKAPPAAPPSVSTRVCAVETVTASKLNILGPLSKLEGIVYRKGQNKDSKSLKRILKTGLGRDLTVSNTGATTLLSKTTQVSFDRAGLLRIKNMATSSSSVGSVQTCKIQVRITTPAGQQLFSMPNSKSFKAPYTFNSFTSEFIYSVATPGTYAIDSLFSCDKTLSPARVTVLSSGTATLIEAYEKE